MVTASAVRALRGLVLGAVLHVEQAAVELRVQGRHVVDGVGAPQHEVQEHLREARKYSTGSTKTNTEY